ncbi:MAG TPA: kynureninase [Actinomycetales bacterium]|jgi:kynureninase
MTTTDTAEQQAIQLDGSDALPTLRASFHVPADPSGRYAEAAYFAGNSLGLQPRATSGRVAQELADWAALGVEGHVKAERPWVSYHELLRDPSARLVGAEPQEVVVMNSLTVNLHLLMVSFYRPTAERHAIVIEDSAFPSDSYAVRSQAAFHGFDPDSSVIRLRPREGESVLRTEDVVAVLAEQGHRVALVLMGAVNYYSGELMDIETITRAGHDVGAVVGWDLAHAAGNVPMRLHEWDVDWAAWCTYKYLNSGPGAVAGAFVHSRHLADRTLPKLAGWWSTDPATRFLMGPEVTPVDTADAWALSNPPILAMVPLLVSLEMFDEVGLDTLREKSLRLTAYLQQQLDGMAAGRGVELLTPRDPRWRGAQISVRVPGSATRVSERLRHEHGVFADARQPDVVRFAPIPLYSTFHDCWRAARALSEVLDSDG